MKRKSAQSILLALALVFIVGLAAAMTGCSKKKTTEAPKEEKPAVEEYVIGAIFSVTGKASFLGDPEKKTVEMLAEQINAEGGINGVPLRVIVEDDAGDEEATKKAASKLIDKDNVLVILGPSRTGNTMVIKEMMGEKQVPLLSCAAAEDIVNPVNPWVFKTPQKDSYVAEHILSYMQKNKITSVAVLYGNEPFGQLGLTKIKEAAPKFGVTIALEAAYQPAATEGDIETLLTNVKKQKGIQAIINWSILPAQSMVPKKMKDLKMDSVKLFHSHGFGNIKYVQDAGDAADGIIFPAGRLLVAEQLSDSDPQKANLVAYKKAYEAKYPGESVSTFGGHAYDALWMAVNAIKAAGAPDKGKIRDALEAVQGFPGTGGVFNMSAEDHNGLGMDSLMLLTVKGGQFAILEQEAPK